jgi:hypothetical protein
MVLNMTTPTRVDIGMYDERADGLNVTPLCVKRVGIIWLGTERGTEVLAKKPANHSFVYRRPWIELSEIDALLIELAEERLLFDSDFARSLGMETS